MTGNTRYAAAELTVDLGALAANFRLLRDRAAPARCAAVVKADAYGLGVAEVARCLLAEGCDTFFVATLDEAIALRAVLPSTGTGSAEIVVLDGFFAGEAAVFREFQLTPTLNDPGQITAWRDAFGGETAAAIHLDTGMSRLGLAPADWGVIEGDSGITVRYLLSHLACADEPAHPMNEQQRRMFAEITAQPDAIRSLAASSGVFLGSGWHFGMVRPGICLYGGAPHPDEDNPENNPMAPVVRLQARVLQIRNVDAPETVGYGAMHRFSGPARVATVAAGYADGYPRALSGQGVVWSGDTAMRVLGRVSMDMITVDATALPDLDSGDVVDLIGPYYGVDDMARDAGTISYEILTRLGRRFGRRYLTPSMKLEDGR